MDLKIHQIYGYPVGVVNLNKNLYNKKKIVKTIVDNFKINKERNKWDKNSSFNIHHAYNDWQNPLYKQIDFKTLLPLYDEVIKNYLEKLFKTPDYQYKFEIINYTCMSKSGYMGDHVHHCEFTLVHYIQFDPLRHKSTCFLNPYPHAAYFNQLGKNLLPVLNEKNSMNSWAFREWHLDIKEDDLIIHPGLMGHKVKSQTSTKKNRITIVSNVTIAGADSLMFSDDHTVRI